MASLFKRGERHKTEKPNVEPPFFVFLTASGIQLLGPIAQLAEHRADNAGVTGAIPVRPTISLLFE